MGKSTFITDEDGMEVHGLSGVLSVLIVPGGVFKTAGASQCKAVHCINLWYLCQKQKPRLLPWFFVFGNLINCGMVSWTKTISFVLLYLRQNIGFCHCLRIKFGLFCLQRYAIAAKFLFLPGRRIPLFSSAGPQNCRVRSHSDTAVLLYLIFGSDSVAIISCLVFSTTLYT